MNTGVSIIGMGAVLPATTLDNAQLEDRFGDRALRSLLKLAGVTSRRVVGPGQCASDLALTAAERVLQGHNFDRSQIDLLIFVSQTPDYRIPTTASVLHGKLGLKTNCAAFDINQACSAYPYALNVAHAMIVSGAAHYALILNADALTSLIHPLDRSLVPLHGDAACATLLGPCEAGYGIEGFSLGTDGAGAKYLNVPAGGARMPSSADTAREARDADGCVRSLDHLRMDGPAVFHFTVYRMPEVIRQTLQSLKLTLDDIDTVILHQANRTIVEMIYKALRVPAEKQFHCIESVGNSSGPSTAVTLAEAWRQGRIAGGSRTLLCSFGAGLAWGTAVIRWPENANPVAAIDPVVPDEEMLSAAL
jgi:3-oxoacyl-[acyl-carrier-protein] synthase III